MNIKIVKCYIKAIIDFLKYGNFIPHRYKDVENKRTIIIATDDSFRTSDNFEHSADETVYPDALLVKSKCICCGKEMLSWYREHWRYVE